MAIIRENITIGSEVLVHTYSDEHKKIRQIETGIVYDDAIDVPNRYTYEETDIESELIIEQQTEQNEVEETEE